MYKGNVYNNNNVVIMPVKCWHCGLLGNMRALWYALTTARAS